MAEFSVGDVGGFSHSCSNTGPSQLKREIATKLNEILHECREGNFDEALRLAEEAVSVTPYFPFDREGRERNQYKAAMLDMKGRVLFDTKRFEDSLECFIGAEALHPSQ